LFVTVSTRRPPGTSMFVHVFLDLIAKQRQQSIKRTAKDSQKEGLSETFYAEYVALHQYLGKVRFTSTTRKCFPRLEGQGLVPTPCLS